MQRLLPGYEHQIIGGAGLSVTAGNDKVVAHTTETGRGSLQPLINHWRVNWGAGLPHFVSEGSRIVQLLPLDVGAYTLENSPGGADTNRSGPAIQIEIVSYAANDWDDDTYDTFGTLLADLKKAGVDFDIEQFPRWYGANEGIVLASYNSPVRMTAQQYIDFNGVCCHQHVPENAHWDCGRKDTDRIKAIYYSRMGQDSQLPPSGDDGPMNETDKQWILGEFANVTARDKIVINDALKAHIGTTMGRDPRDNRVYEFERPGLTKRYVVGPEEFSTLAFYGIPYVGDLPASLIDARVTIPELDDEAKKDIATFTAEEIEKTLKEVVDFTRLSTEEQNALAEANKPA